MSDVISASFDGLATAAGQLRLGGDDAENLRTDAPGVPDAGEFSGAAAAVLAHLTVAAGEVVIGLGAAADSYSVTEQTARD